MKMHPISNSRLSMMLLPIAGMVCIILSVSQVMATPEPLQCYWCGPLANQVHRSHLPPPCDADDNHVTVCEAGYSYCATVYSSPPQIESRLCVKEYQDKCVAKNCNSSNTWKITCACRGDLCNVRDVEREKDAFDTLNKLVAQKYNYRQTKRSVNFAAPSAPAKHFRNHKSGGKLMDEDNVAKSTPVPSSSEPQTYDTTSQVSSSSADLYTNSPTALESNATPDKPNDPAGVSNGDSVVDSSSDTSYTPSSNSDNNVTTERLITDAVVGENEYQDKSIQSDQHFRLPDYFDDRSEKRDNVISESTPTQTSVSIDDTTDLNITIKSNKSSNCSFCIPALNNKKNIYGTSKKNNASYVNLNVAHSIIIAMIYYITRI